MTPLNAFRSQLQRLLGNREEFANAKFVGRACYVPLEDGTKIKAEFITSSISNQYDTLRLSAINASEGVVDKLSLRFRDYFSPRQIGSGTEVVPHLWDDYGKVSWYIAPSKLELLALQDAACEYVSLFDQSQEEGYTMGM